MDTAVRFTILVVGGDDAARNLRTCLLNAHGFGVQETGSSEEALRLARGGGVDLVLLDCPGVPELCGRLKDAAPLLPVVRIAGSAGAENCADAWLADPVEPELLVNTLRAVLDTKRAEAVAWSFHQPQAGGAARLPQPYGDLAALNTERVLADAVGDMLHDIASDSLDVLETSTAIYERNGDYALGLMHSGWCRLLDQASREMCGTADNREALQSGRWICHEECWRSSRQSIETGQPADMECAGGIRLYAVPIFAGGQAVGSMNIGYGAPPSDPAKLAAIAARFGVDAERLREEAGRYRTRPPAVVENAKKRLAVSARLAGALVERKRAEEAARRAARYLSRLHDVAAALSEAVTTAQVLDTIVRRVVEAAGAEAGVLALLDDRQELVAARMAGFAAEDAARYRRFPLSAVIGEAVRACEAVLSDPLDGGAALAAVPLLAAHTAIGGLGLRFAAPRRLGPEDREFLLAVGRECSQALERARLYDAQQRAREDLSAQNRRLEELFTALPAPLVVYQGAEHVVEFNNPANLALWGGRDSLGMSLRQAYPEIDAGGYPALWDRVYQTGEPFHARELCAPVERGAGKTEDRYFDLSLVPRRDSAGNVTGVLSFAVDVTEQVLARRELEAQRAFIATVLNQMPIGVAIAEAKSGEIVFSNREAQRLLGECLPTRISLASANPVESAIARAVVGHATQKDEVACPCSCPTAAFSVHAAPIRRPDGEILAAVCAFQDVTGRQKAQGLLRRQAQMINLSHDAIITATPDHVITAWNAGAEEMYGWTAAEAVGRKSYELIGTGLAIAEINASLVSEGRWDGELRNYRHDGAEIVVESRQILLPASDGEPAGILKIHRDITARKQALEALRESQEWRKFTQQAAGIGIIDWDLRNHRAKCSEEFFALFGVDAAAMEQTIAGWLRLVHPDDREGVERRVEAALREREPFEVEFRVMRPDGAMAWMAAKFAVFFDAAGRPERAIAAQMDVTARKSAEQAHYGAQKLESIGLLAGGVAHDFNNLLTTVLGHASLLLPNAAPATRESLEAIIAGSERAAELTRQLLAYAGKAPFHIREADLSALVRGMADLLRLSIPKSIDLEVDLAARLPAIKIDTGQFQQVIMNLVMNAAEAIGEARTGMVGISTSRRTVDGPLAIRPGEELPPGSYCCLEVSDTGCGMEAATAVRIFEPFFTTKFLGRGLGLAAVAGIMRSHHGAIAVRSTPGQGSTFTVFYPAAGEPAPVEPPEPEPEASHGTGVVLIVDDEAIVRQFLACAVSQFGYSAVEAGNGAEALAALEEHPEITVVLLDIVMPVMGGADALAGIKRLRPGLPVLVTSGYNEAEAQRLCAAHGSLQFIQKPYSAAQLAARIKAVMARAASA